MSCWHKFYTKYIVPFYTSTVLGTTVSSSLGSLAASTSQATPTPPPLYAATSKKPT